MRNRTSLVLGSTHLVLLFACNGGGGSGTGGVDTGGTTDGGLDSTGVQTSANDTSAENGTAMTGADTGVTSADDSGSGTAGASESGCMGECTVDDDCLPGQSCLACTCLGEPTGCDAWGAGAFGDCVTMGNAACMGNGTCVVDDPAAATAGVCFATGCETPCDCPQPPKGFEAQVGCEDLIGDDMLDCFIDCGGGAACPDGMFCFMGTLCFWGEAPAGVPPYGDCVNEGAGPCEEGICVSDDPADPTVGACFSPCMDAADCPAPRSGAAPAICDDITGDMMNECMLDCSDDQACPDGMICENQFGICLWEVVVPAEPGYGDCANAAEAVACVEGETCFTSDGGAVCSAPCTMPEDCPPAPASGDAPVACADLGGGASQCHLDCSAGQACPSGSTCFNDTYCRFTTQLLFEHFDGGVLPDGWTVVDVDGNTPAGGVSFINQAWTVAAQLTPGDFAAYSTSWYLPAAQADDWLITPQITPSATSQLQWIAQAPDENFPDGYEVRVSTATADPADFTDVLLTIDAEMADYTPHSLDLSAYADMPIFIAFRNNSNDMFVLIVDEVLVTL